ncbi:uncharacterized protein MELLADRAFT_75229 [Melampsora larici-populina 98AG31]|uniref:Translation initiation factor eIF4e n=1 Tax=Melampsora larici-populina (strain 98AG31 / pathotype 3-4-7) TaxID=747676 RepID=F4RU44_MELLP|nr:uncharacterized protein MELLADRAFT_75229 [Melampsora larici-populina 98AG31]EGG04146.1 hypothetical protein MELLADRAFT_75229 [Melampsora larici-populina 98AG31]
MKSNQLKASEYQSGMSVVFDRIESVENLCESLMGFKKFMGIRLKGIGLMGLEKPGCGIGLVGFRAQQNLHFFRVGVGPVWEDPWNSKGGRLTISLNISILDRIFETLILLTAGGVIEDETDYKGKITGIVGSRRSRGDRIEIWLSGNRLGESPNEDWIKDVIGCLGREIGNEVGGIKYKKHL